MKRERFVIELKGQIFNLSDDSTLAVARVLGIPHLDSITPQQMQEAILKKCDEKPEEVKAVVDDVNSDIEAVLREAKDKHVIVHLKDEGRFMMDSKEVFKYKPGIMAKPYNMFAVHISENDMDLLMTIKKKIRLFKNKDKE